jgi:hypothetical protein
MALTEAPPGEILILPSGKYRAVLVNGATVDFDSMTLSNTTGELILRANDTTFANSTYDEFHFTSAGAARPIINDAPGPIPPEPLTYSDQPRIERLAMRCTDNCNGTAIGSGNRPPIHFYPSSLGQVEISGRK